MSDIAKRIFKKGYNRELSSKSIAEESKRLFFYMIRWQLSTPILAGVTIWFASLDKWVAAALANLIGSLIFYWIDKLIFKPNSKEYVDSKK